MTETIDSSVKEEHFLEDVHFLTRSVATQFATIQQDIAFCFGRNLSEDTEREIKDAVYPLEDDLSKLNRWAEQAHQIGLVSSHGELSDALAMYSEVRGKMKDFLQFYYTKILQNPLFYMLKNKGQVMIDAMKTLAIIIERLIAFEKEKFGDVQD